MAWDSTAPDLGFGGAAVNAKPWLPVAESHRALAVDVQRGDPQSLLNHYQQLLHWRRGVPALIQGDMALLPSHPQVLAYVRSHAGERVLCAFNFSDQPVSWEAAAAGAIGQVLGDSGAQGATPQGSQVRFEPWGVLFARLV